MFWVKGSLYLSRSLGFRAYGFKGANSLMLRAEVIGLLAVFCGKGAASQLNTRFVRRGTCE